MSFKKRTISKKNNVRTAGGGDSDEVCKTSFFDARDSLDLYQKLYLFLIGGAFNSY